MKLIFAMVLMSGCISSALGDPVVGNVRASQRVGTRLVDVYYDLANASGTVKIDIQVSSDGGATYTVPATSFSGAIGASVEPGNDLHVVWNAGADWPAKVSPSMRFRVCADDALPPESSYDPDAVEFFNRAIVSGDNVTAAARSQIDLFVREAKRIGIWDKLVYVPCRKGFGALNPLGGSPKRTNAKFVREGVTELTADGVKFVPGSGYLNRIKASPGWNSADLPAFVGVLGYVLSGHDSNPSASWLRTGLDASVNLLGTAPGFQSFVSGFTTPGATGGEFAVSSPDFVTIRKPNFVGAQFDGSGTVLKSVFGSLYSETSSASATTGEPSGSVYFMEPAVNDTNVVQGCLLAYGDVSTQPMQSVSSLLQSTLLKDSWGRYVYFHLGGQSNANPVLAESISKGGWKSPGSPLYHYSTSWYPGQPISNWVGGDPQNPLRTSAYLASTSTWLSKKPLVSNSEWDSTYLWVQGESDAYNPFALAGYQGQLAGLVGFLRQDLRSDLQMAICQIDYSIALRTAPEQGNFELAGLAGSAAAANGIFTIAPITGIENSFNPYSWSKGDWHITKDGGDLGDRWRIHSEGVTYYTSVQVEDHPVLVASWVSANGGGGNPVVHYSLTGGTERIRAAQRNFVAQDTNSFLIDSRGCQRYLDIGVNDGVHMTTAGYQELANRFVSAFSQFRP